MIVRCFHMARIPAKAGELEETLERIRRTAKKNGCALYYAAVPEPNGDYQIYVNEENQMLPNVSKELESNSSAETNSTGSHSMASGSPGL